MGTAGSPPNIRPSSSLTSQAVFTGANATFSATVTGDPPFSYQWRRHGQELPAQTNRVFNLKAAQTADDGDYDLVVSNALGTATSYSVHLHVVPASDNLIWGHYTNAANLRLPYRYYVPKAYDSTRRYPLIIQLHGSSEPPIDETTFASYFPAQFYSYTSHGRQTSEPAFVVYPTRRRGDGAWTDSYVKLLADFLDGLIRQWSIDTNRVYVIGTSEGVHAVWDLLGQRPTLFAAAGLAAGWKGTTAPATIKHVPLWVWQAADDPDVNVSSSRGLVRTLRQASGHPIYTEFQTGGHVGGMRGGLLCPAIHQWLMEQRRGTIPVNGPCLSIVSPPGNDFLATVAAALDLAGTAQDYSAPVARVRWENLTTGSEGDAAGTKNWTVAGIP